MDVAVQSERVERVDYAGAVYGSLLAASVVVGSAPRHTPTPALSLVVLLLATGVVFWLAHVYASLAGDREKGAPLTKQEVRQVGSREWPLAQAAVPPAAAAALCWLLGLSNATAAWCALFVALASQVGWTVVAGTRSNAKPLLIVVSAVVNLLLGLVIVMLKVVLTH
ncbi:hypothetical protein J4573_10080 [Actinomadura barringtoniae]|uniref:Integral membrane protein n=1 Tax=Actinomadura barringtoniae TaxID=1427535 RepID=A0A939PD18_9ACTN|nr:hypothetical protein [Actinomadura barringtoniae]MBO2447434.1 hypothetical protein [Actinomadura barringtoniae]